MYVFVHVCRFSGKSFISVSVVMSVRSVIGVKKKRVDPVSGCEQVWNEKEKRWEWKDEPLAKEVKA